MTVEEKQPRKVTDRAGHENRFSRFRQWVRRRPGVDLAYRILVGVVGTVVLAAGILAIPYPGPGWLILFAGLALLGTEFTWARRVLHWTRARYDAWTGWVRRQPAVVRLGVIVLTGAVVLVTLWLVNALGFVAGWVGLRWDWVRSPLA
ncbi:MAG: TIGR02611 family protein [Pseudonocardiales bacterium]|nr:MAG: TIGR02611 family protein [Pseudonocardiales bacterium]